MSLHTIPVYVNHSYNIYCGRGIIDDAIVRIKEKFENCKIAIITDTTVSEQHAYLLEKKLKKLGMFPTMIAFPNNESIKTLEIVGSITQSLFDMRFGKVDVIIGLGGGTVLDVAGVVSYTYLGGIPLIQIPTTYVAAIDMSVTREYHVNASIYKEVISLPSIPTMVIIDYNYFASLTDENTKSAQIVSVKYAMISDASMLENIVRGDFEYIIQRCISIKKSLLQTFSPNNDGLSQLLNFGNLLGATIETISGYRIDYSNALAVAMKIELEGACRLQLSRGVDAVYSEFLESISITPKADIETKNLIELYLTKLKIQEGKVSIPIVEEVGKCHLYQLTSRELEVYISQS